MPTKDMRIVYNDGRIQEIKAEGYNVHGSFMYFTRDGNHVLVVATDKIESVADADVSEAA